MEIHQSVAARTLLCRSLPGGRRGLKLIIRSSKPTLDHLCCLSEVRWCLDWWASLCLLSSPESWTRRILYRSNAKPVCIYQLFSTISKTISERSRLVLCWMVSGPWGGWSRWTCPITANTDSKDPLWIVDADCGGAILSHIDCGSIDDVGVLATRHLSLDALGERSLAHGKISLAHPRNSH